MQAIIFLKQVLKLTSGYIILVWDNHKIHLSPQTQEFINDHPHMHEYRFPTGAPELNPIPWSSCGRKSVNIRQVLRRTTFKNCVIGCKLASLVQEFLKTGCWPA
ncbi:MAG: transposase [Chloroflexi bacterium]|nr:transposase [Chloroflexota bacterium]